MRLASTPKLITVVSDSSLKKEFMGFQIEKNTSAIF